MKKFINKLKKGFTLVELAIVIAVIAILVAVLVPTFVALIDKANESSDKQMIKNINTLLTTEDAMSGINNPSQALDAANEAGYSIDKLTPTSEGNSIVYDESTKTFALIDSDNKILYSQNNVEIDVDAPTTWWIVTDASAMTSSTRSYILTGDYTADVGSAQLAKTSISGKSVAEATVATISNGVLSYTGMGGINIYGDVTGITSISYTYEASSDYVTEGEEIVLLLNINLQEVSISTSVSITITSFNSTNTITKITTSGNAEVTVNDNNGSVYQGDSNSVTVNSLGSEEATQVSTDTTISTSGGILQLGTEKYPYLIESVSDLLNIKAGSSDNILYYQLNADLDLKDCEYSYGTYKLENVYFNGNGHKIYCSETKSMYGVFCYAYETVTIYDLEYDLSNLNHSDWAADLVPLIYDVSEINCFSGSTDLTIEDVKITGTHSVDSNNAPFIFNEHIVDNSVISLINCEMAATLSGGGYNACFIGWQGDWTDENDKYLNLAGGSINYIGCTVSGSLVCPFAGMYTANASHAYEKSYTFSDNYITGTIRGTSTVNLFCGNGSDTTCDIYTNAVANTNYTTFQLYVGATDTSLSISADTDGKITFTASDNSSVTKYIVYVGIYTNFYNTDGKKTGTWQYYATETIEVTENTELSTVLMNIGFVDASYCEDNSITTQTDSAGNEYAVIGGSTYYVIRDFSNSSGQGYVGSPTEGGITGAKNIVRICSYLSDGTMYSSAEL